jgi:hypothetical protein
LSSFERLILGGGRRWRGVIAYFDWIRPWAWVFIEQLWTCYHRPMIADTGILVGSSTSRSGAAALWEIFEQCSTRDENHSEDREGGKEFEVEVLIRDAKQFSSKDDCHFIYQSSTFFRPSLQFFSCTFTIIPHSQCHTYRR